MSEVSVSRLPLRGLAPNQIKACEKLTIQRSADGLGFDVVTIEPAGVEEDMPDIPATAFITDARTDIERTHDFDFYGDYIWAEGNYACDCNRALFYGARTSECGMDRYRVRIQAKDDGRILYEDS